MYLLQIVTPDGTVLRFHAGEHVELDLRKALRDAIVKQLDLGALRDAVLARGVGLFKTEAHVAADLDAVIGAAQLTLNSDLDAAITKALEDFKATAAPWKVIA